MQRKHPNILSINLLVFALAMCVCVCALKTGCTFTGHLFVADHNDDPPIITQLCIRPGSSQLSKGHMVTNVVAVHSELGHLASSVPCSIIC